MKKALIVWEAWDGHQPKRSAQLFADKLSERQFEVEVRDSLDVFLDRERMSELALIVPIWTMGTLDKEQTVGLLGAVRDQGVGLAGFHGGMGDSFRGNIDYQWAVGGQFLAHPDGIKRHRVEIIRRDDPIVAGIPDFDVVTEQYYMLVDPRNTILATTTHRSASAPWTDGVVMPYVWTKSHGAGRVFFSALGHVPKEFLDVPEQLELTLRGMDWAARA